MITVYASLSEWLTPIMSPVDRENEDAACDLALELSADRMEDTLIEVWDDNALIAQYENGKRPFETGSRTQVGCVKTHE